MNVDIIFGGINFSRGCDALDEGFFKMQRNVFGLIFTQFLTVESQFGNFSFNFERCLAPETSFQQKT